MSEIGVLIMTGIPGAGKPSVVRRLAERCPVAAHNESDASQYLIVSDGLHRDRESREESERQLRSRTRNVALLSDGFVEHRTVPFVDELLEHATAA